VLSAVERDLLRVEVLETALYKAMSTLCSQTEVMDHRYQQLHEELARLDAEVARLANAIAAGGDLPALLALLQQRERRRTHVRVELAEAEQAQVATTRDRFDVEQILRALREQLTDWQGMLRQETAAARHALRALLVGRLVFKPEDRAGGRFYTFSGEGTITLVIAGTALQHLWWPQGDSISRVCSRGSLSEGLHRPRSRLATANPAPPVTTVLVLLKRSRSFHVAPPPTKPYAEALPRLPAQLGLGAPAPPRSHLRGDAGSREDDGSIVLADGGPHPAGPLVDHYSPDALVLHSLQHEPAVRPMDLGDG
jgi:hypothetical protein